MNGHTYLCIHRIVTDNHSGLNQNFCGIFYTYFLKLASVTNQINPANLQKIVVRNFFQVSKPNYYRTNKNL